MIHTSKLGRVSRRYTMHESFISMATGFLYSQIAYDTADSKRALIRACTDDFVGKEAVLEILPAGGSEVVQSSSIRPWGKKWQHWWWVADFSEFQGQGLFELRFRQGDQILHQSKPLVFGDQELWKATFPVVALEQLKFRRDQARNQLGFKDCGHHWREASSHGGLLLGLTDMLEVGFQHMAPDELAILRSHLIHGCDYLEICQDTAAKLGLGDGSLVHEIPSVLHVIPGNVAMAAVIWARSARLLCEIEPERAFDYLSRAKRAFRYLREEASPWIQGFHAASHGAPADFQPTGSWMTRDLVTMMWAALELWQAGGSNYQRVATELARQIMARQVDESEAEFGLYGHFRTFDEARFTEKANVHHHWGHDTGAVLPHYLFPMAMMVRLWGYHPDVQLWRQCLVRFVKGYFIPACNSNPFKIIPMGVWDNEGVLTFSGPWHGCNVTIGYASALASILQFVLGTEVDGEELRAIAVANLQWIAGLNAGLTRDSFGSCLKYREEVPEGQALPVSMIVGLGLHQAGAWTAIPGTIMNGFSNNPQFQHANVPREYTDGPWFFTDEDWIPHTGGYLAGLAWLREGNFFRT